MIQIPTVLKFDFDIESIVKKMLDVATKDYPNRLWTFVVTYWSDGTFMIRLHNGYGEKHHVYTYRKAENTCHKQIVRPFGFASGEEVLEDEKISLFEVKTQNE